jgi:uncharacterized protein (TIGR00251 family)
MARTVSPVEQAPFVAEKEGVRLAVRLTPRAGRNRLDGVVAETDGRMALRVRIAAPPVEGAANKALMEFLCEALDLRKADIRIQSGETARLKILFLSGDSASIMTRLAAWIDKRSLQP